MTTDPTSGPRPAAWFDISARDAARTRQFYGDLFGWEIRVLEAMNYGLVEAAPDRIPGGIGQAGADNPHPAGVVIYFVVDDVDAAIAKAGQLGGTVAVPAWELPGLGRMAVFTDPDGNRVGVWSGPADAVPG